MYKHIVIDSPNIPFFFTASPNAGADYNSVSTLVSFSAGGGPLTLSQPSVSITIINDNSVEQTETFGLTGTITSGGALARFVDNTATAQIIDDDGKVKNTCVHIQYVTLHCDPNAHENPPLVKKINVVIYIQDRASESCSHFGKLVLDFTSIYAFQ